MLHIYELDDKDASFDADIYKCKEDESETNCYAVCEGYGSSTSERETSVTRLIH